MFIAGGAYWLWHVVVDLDVPLGRLHRDSVWS